MRRFGSWSWVAFVLSATTGGGSLAQDAGDLNRSGRWAEAAASASSQIEGPGLSLEDKCEAYFNLVYAELRLGRLDAATDHMGAFDRTCADVKVPWLGREADRLRAELEGQKPSTDGWEPMPDPPETSLYVFSGLDLVVVRMQSRARPGAGPYQPEALDLFRRLRSHRGDPLDRSSRDGFVAHGARE